MVTSINKEEILKTYKRIEKEIRHSPILKAEVIPHPLPHPCQLYFKLEQHQVTGSFKIRGVTNKIMCAEEKILANGLVAASGGNHGRAVAYAGWRHKLPTAVYLPESTPDEKIKLIKDWGAQVYISGKDLDEANQIALKDAEKKNALFIHPYADPDVILGQGTIAVELLNQLKDIEMVIVAIGGGGLISGVGTYLKALNPSIKIIGVEPVGCPTLYNSFKAGKIIPVEKIQTTVGTLAIRQTSQINYDLATQCVDEIVLVQDEDMLRACQWLWQEFGIAAERSGAASLAALLSGKVKPKENEKVCCLICGLGKDGL